MLHPWQHVTQITQFMPCYVTCPLPGPTTQTPASGADLPQFRPLNLILIRIRYAAARYHTGM